MNFKKIYEKDVVAVFEVAPDIYFRKSSLHKRGQCNGAYFVSADGVSIVDAPPNALEMVDEVKQLFDKPVRRLFLTHTHSDHAVDLSKFYDQDITIYCSRRALEQLAPDTAKHRANFVSVDGMMHLLLSGGLELELFTLPDTTHSKWDMFIRSPRDGVLVTGDSTVVYQTTYFHAADIGSWISALRPLAAQPGKIILPGHGDEPYPYSYMNEFIEYLAAIDRAALECSKSFGCRQKSADSPSWEKCRDVSAVKVRDVVEEYFVKNGDDAAFIESCAGGDNSRRVVRMVLWFKLRSILV